VFPQYFYHRLIRKYIVLFGSLFNNITVMRYNDDFTVEIERLKVPVNWAAKEKYTQKMALESETPMVQVVYPRMSFELLGITYDATRKQANMQRHATLSSNNSLAWSSYSPAPYNLEFRLNIHARNIEDIAQIIEQILPVFQPDYTPTADLIANLDIPKDIKIILRDITPQFGFEGQLGADTRDVAASMTFTMQAFFFGPVALKPLITKVIARVYPEDYEPTLFALGNGGGTYIDNDIVYQGNSYTYATATGIVRDFYNQGNTRQLLINVVRGTFRTNIEIMSTSTNASYNLVAFGDNVSPSSVINVTPIPVNVDPRDPFGINVSIYFDGTGYN
jgi:hypothetical protein